MIEKHFWIEGSLALVAALFAIALRRQHRLFKAPGFIMLAVGLIIDMMIPQTQEWRNWAHVGRAVALLLVTFGLIRLAVEAFLIIRYRRKADPSTIVRRNQFSPSSYGIIGLAVMRFMLGIDPRVLLAVPALGTLVADGFGRRISSADCCSSTHRPFVSGDWVRLGDHLWPRRRNRMARDLDHHAQQRARADSQCGAGVAEPVVNYSSGGAMVADEVYLEIDREVAPAIASSRPSARCFAAFPKCSPARSICRSTGAR